MERIETWFEFAESKFKGTGIKAFVCPGNDDMFEIDEVLNRSEYVIPAEGQVFGLDDGCQLLNAGWSNPTPWDTFREEPEEKLME